MFKYLKFVFYYIFGNLACLFIYKKKYIYGKFFKFNGRGWMWAFRDLSARIFLGVNRGVPYPISFKNSVNTPTNIIFDSNDLQIFQGQGKYFQAEDAKIYIGAGTHIANNVGIITTNHELNDPSYHQKGEEILIGKKCWLGFNCVVLPGVILGDNTVVAAGAVVTHSFKEGHCVIAGVPAKKIKDI